MKKTTTIVTVVLLVVIAGVVGVFAIMAGRTKDEREQAAPTAVEKILSRDLSKDYPPTVKEVIKYYAEIQKYFYAEGTTDEELEALGMKARELYDSELLEKNGMEGYLVKLKADVQSFNDSKRTFTGSSVAGSVNADFFQEDGYEFARLNCTYYIVEAGVTKSVDIIYLLRRDEKKKWKIYGWDNAENVHVQ